MRNRVTIHIAGSSYTMLAEESESYMQEVANLVDSKIGEARKTPGVSMLQAAVLAACNIADSYYKAVSVADNLRAQMKNYLEESNTLRRELAEAHHLLDEITAPEDHKKTAGGHAKR